jgi:hypothetical protein
MREYDEPWKLVGRASSFSGARLSHSASLWRRKAPKIAAAVLVTTVGGIAWGLYQQSRINGLIAPQSVPVAAVLFPEGEAVRGIPYDHKPLPENTRTTLTLASRAEPEAFSSYEVLIEEPSGELFSRVLSEGRGDDGGLTVFLPVGLPEGNYRFQVLGITDGRKTPLESYRVSVRRRGP